MQIAKLKQEQLRLAKRKPLGGYYSILEGKAVIKIKETGKISKKIKINEKPLTIL